jgi:3-hydroxyisobutyrate dehydrogenase
MCRSVVVKGLEALMLESLLTARRFGVEQAVLDSLQSSGPADAWRTQGRYMISRALVHGRRRAEEMREAAHTVAEAGLVPRMSDACAGWQEWAADHSAATAANPLASQALEQMLDALLASPRAAASC